MGVSWPARVSLACLICAFVFMVVSHLSPFWYMEEPYTHIGLWEKCEWRQPCVWSHENHFYWEIIQPTWWHVCQVLYSVALFTMFVNLILTIEVNCVSDVGILPKIVNMAFMALAFIEIIATLGHFGRMAHAERGVVVDDEAYRNFGWAYLLGCIAALLLLLALIFFALSYTKDRKKQEKNQEEFANPMLGFPPMMPPHMQYQYQSQQFQPPPQLQPPPQQFRPPPQHYAPQPQQYHPVSQQQQQYAQEKQGLNYQ